MKRFVSFAFASWIVFTGVSLHAASGARTYVSGHFALYVDGQFAGWVSKVAGGFAEGNVIEETPGPLDGYVQKHLEAPPGYKEIVFQTGTGMSAAFYNWIAATLQSDYTRHDGEIVAFDYGSKVIRRLEFEKAQISEIAFPALDAASKDVAVMTVSLSPVSTQNLPGGTATPPPTCSQQKQWLASNFRLTIDGLDMTKTRKVDAFVVTVPVIPPGLACIPEFFCPPRAIDFPNLGITIADQNAQPVISWYEQSVFWGGGEKNGAIEYLTSNLATTLFKLDIFNIGAITVETIDSTEAVKKDLLRAYTEHMNFTTVSGACN